MAINISFTRCGLLNRTEVLEEMFLTVLLNESSLICIFYDARGICKISAVAF